MTKPPSTLPKAPRYPVSSFGPELMAVLLKGANEVICLKFPNLNKATYFQHRIHTLRSSMRKEGHPLAELVSRAKFKRVWGAKLYEHYKDEKYKEFLEDHKGARCCHIIVQPNDIEFGDILTEAGVEVPKPKIPDPAPLPSEPSPALPGVTEIELNGPAFEDPYADYKGGDSNAD